MARPSESDLIARYFAPIAGPGGLSLRDDAALFLPRAGQELVVTVDALVDRAHFLPDDPPETIGRKALAVNVSDLAAKGAEPLGFVLALALPADWSEPWLAAFAAGLGEAAREWDCPLLGGDTVRASGALTLAVTAFGEVPAGRMVRRSGARAGDVVCVTGTIGDAALGLLVRRDGADLGIGDDLRAFLADRYRRPRPRIALAPLLREVASAAMDVSDGLAGDLAKMMRVSGETACVDVESIPLSEAAAAALAVDPTLIDRVLTGGDDYEILFTVPPERLDRLEDEAAALGVPVAKIGQVVEGGGRPVFVTGDTERVYEAGAFSHF